MDWTSREEQAVSFAEAARRIKEKVADKKVTGPLWVYTPTDVERFHLSERLRGELPEAVFVDALGLEQVDAPAHAAFQVTAAEHIELLNEKRPLWERATEGAKELAVKRRPLILIVPRSWFDSRFPREPDRYYRLQKAQRLLYTWMHIVDLRLAVITDNGPSVAQAGNTSTLCVTATKTIDDKIYSSDIWKNYASYAQALVSELGNRASQLPEPVARLAIGAIALGEKVDEVKAMTSGGDALRLLLEKLIAPALDRAEHASLRQAVQRLLYIRQPIEPQKMLELTLPPTEHAPFLLECLSSGEERYRISDTLRRGFARLWSGDVRQSRPTNPDSQTRLHQSLAEHYSQLDGRADPREARGQTLVYWLEKVHHLAHSGRDGAAEWEKQLRYAPDFYLDRARSLSIEFHEYREAARLYRECIALESNEAYAWHYLGYNLDLAGENREAAEAAFRKAVEYEPTNPWFNSRLVTFLIQQARYLDAEQAWREALQNLYALPILPPQSRWLARHFHAWIVKSWLGAGEISRAREAFDRIPVSDLGKDERLRALAHLLADAEETETLGDSVRPPGMPLDKRWEPSVLPECSPVGKPRRAWFPGRVVEASSKSVRLVFALPDPDPTLRRLYAKTVSAVVWRKAAQRHPREAEGYVEIGEYEDGTLIIEKVPEPALPARIPVPDQLRYMKRWHSQ